MMPKECHKYDDIIHLSHHISSRHPQMSPLNRAAQFSPFAALTGHGAAIRETARQTDTFVELEEDQVQQLDQFLRQLQTELSREPEVKITYFQPDMRKDGGTYITISKKLQKIDQCHHTLLFTDGTTLPVRMLYSIERV